ncbi:MAG: hypothetical protein QOF76_3095, partial [Solirubrobacteraceae bacterium]|nr:hypothetical protein [Solirubrobacteraceae bacterium]
IARAPARACSSPPTRACRTWWRARSCRPARASTGRGWVLLTLDPDKIVVEYRRGDLTRPDGGSQAFERFTQANGTNRVTRESLAV